MRNQLAWVLLILPLSTWAFVGPKDDLDVLCKSLRSENPKVRRTAAKQLQAFQELSETVLNKVIDSYLSEEEASVFLGLQAVMLKNQDRAIPIVLAYATDALEKRSRRVTAVFFLELCNQRGQLVLDSLDKLVGDKDKHVSIRAAVYVLERNALSNKAMDVLIQRLKEDKKDTYYLLNVVRALAKTSRSQAAIPYLMENLTDMHSRLRKGGERNQVTNSRIEGSKDIIYHLWFSKSHLVEYRETIIKQYNEIRLDPKLRSELTLFYATLLFHMENSSRTDFKLGVRQRVIESIERFPAHFERPYGLMFVQVSGQLGKAGVPLLRQLEELSTSSSSEMRHAALKAVLQIKSSCCGK